MIEYMKNGNKIKKTESQEIDVDNELALLENNKSVLESRLAEINKAISELNKIK